MTNADLTWNRACLEEGGAQPREGDAALFAMLRFHGLAMNGGVCHAVECLAPAELAEAIHGYEFYGVIGIVPIVDAAQNVPADDDEAGELELRLDAEYAATVSDGDAALVHRCHEHFAAHPEQYAPLD
ncbi:hypothetical protein [Anaeromyxobacter oryzisoli]|uniref:hypothetical protein n=1 Tax=Anaeromyxobacter oryzisoli TaxID=2925408 RepID=UPI001F57B0B9|nr:hypothetical protein [Anaeromyxobacter sp. SG63]